MRSSAVARGETVRVGPFDLYATCPACGQRVKVRAFSASPDVEDVFDAVFGWITLQVHSSLESVGITSAVSTALARVGISCNVLAGFYHDHLLVPVDDVDEAVDVLGGLS